MRSLLLDLDELVLLLEELFLLFNKVEFFFGLGLLDFIVVFIGFLFNSNGVLGSLSFDLILFLSNLIKSFLLFLVDFLVLNLDLSGELINFLGQSLALSFESSFIGVTLLLGEGASLLGSIFLNVQLESPLSDNSSSSSDNLGNSNSSLGDLNLLEFVSFFN